MSDTVLAILPAPLVVQVRGLDGRVLAREVVEFEPLSYGDPNRLTSLVAPDGMPRAFATSVADTTDGNGQVRVWVRFTVNAGNAAVAIRVPALNLSATATFTARPGTPHGVSIEPADTAVYPGRTFMLRGGVVDRFGNFTGTAATLSTNSSAFRISSGQVVNGVSIGRASVLARSGSWVDTSWVSVVPMGTIAAVTRAGRTGDGPGIAVLNLDGSGFQRFPVAARAGEPSAPGWVDNGTRIVFAANLDGYERLYTLDLAGNATRLVQWPNEALWENGPSAPWHGPWIYYLAGLLFSEGVLRVRPDGSELERITPYGDPFTSSASLAQSPDGNRLAFLSRSAVNSDWMLYVRDVRTGSVTSLGVKAISAAWSPNGEWIAYVHPGTGVRVIRPDGSDDRLVSGTGFELRMGWSPDSKYLVGRLNDAMALYLIDVDTGNQLRLGFTGSLHSPSWRR